MKFSKIIVLPTYNEEENLGKVLETLKNNYPEFFLLVVDDSDNDLTENLFNKFNYQNSKIIKRNKKMGRGSSVRLGFEYAVKNDFSTIAEMDSDCSHEPLELKNLIDHFMKNNCDLVIGSRYLKDSKIINWGFKRIFFSKLANYLAKLLFNYPVTDYTNGYRVYNKKLVKKILEYPQLNSGFIYLTEILLIVFNNNYKCLEVPTTFVNRTMGKSSVNLRSITSSFFGIIRLKLNSKVF